MKILNKQILKLNFGCRQGKCIAYTILSESCSCRRPFNCHNDLTLGTVFFPNLVIQVFYCAVLPMALNMATHSPQHLEFHFCFSCYIKDFQRLTPVLPLNRAQIFVKTEIVPLDFLSKREQFFLQLVSLAYVSLCQR